MNPREEAPTRRGGVGGKIQSQDGECGGGVQGKEGILKGVFHAAD